MASYQRIALFILFDAIERDLVESIRRYSAGEPELSLEEVEKGRRNIGSRAGSRLDEDDPFDQLHGLDLFEKFQVLLRHKTKMDASTKDYYLSLKDGFLQVVPVRNTVMHGRPLTISEYSIGFAFAQSLLSAKSRWPDLARTYLQYSREPEALVARSVEFFDEPVVERVLNNLPAPDYDDTGFLPRPELERDLKRKILGRHPVVTVLGDGGNGKTALALQTLYGLLESQDHNFDAILWFSAKASTLGVNGIEQIKDAVTESLLIVQEIADFERGSDPPIERLMRLLKDNAVLLAIDNLETVTGTALKTLAEEVPGQSKLLFTSRVPVGADVTVNVEEFKDGEALTYLRTLARAYGVKSLRSADDDTLQRFSKRLGNKPLLLKWLTLGVKSGLDPNQITADPKAALKFCLENVMDRLGEEAKAAVVVLATVPMPLSGSILSQVSGLSLQQAGDGISELARFGLLETVETEGSERLFRLRSFARSYVMRIVSPRAETANEIRTRFARLEGEFQNERSRGRYNPYDGRCYMVRSLSELVASQRLQTATKAALYSDCDTADEILEQVKRSEPGYFEVYRAEAYIALQSNDILRAIGAYEAALEFGDDQPQLHFFFGGLLMRAGYNDRAAQEFERGIKLDPNSSPLYREAARNELTRHNFAGARGYLDKALSSSSRSDRDRTILYDLRLQSYIRELDFFTRTGNLMGAKEALPALLDELAKTELDIIDQKMSEHIIGVLPILARIEDRLRRDTPDAVSQIRQWVKENLQQESSLKRPSTSMNSNSPTKRTGSLKQWGLRNTFGFIVDQDTGEEFFIHASTMDEDIWRALRFGATASFDTFIRKDGRTQAKDILLISN